MTKEIKEEQVEGVDEVVEEQRPTLKEQVYAWVGIEHIDNIIQESNEFQEKVGGVETDVTIANLPTIQEAYDDAWGLVEGNISAEDLAAYEEAANKVVPHLTNMISRFQQLRSIGEGGFVTDNFKE